MKPLLLSLVFVLSTASAAALTPAQKFGSGELQVSGHLELQSHRVFGRGALEKIPSGPVAVKFSEWTGMGSLFHDKGRHLTLRMDGQDFRFFIPRTQIHLDQSFKVSAQESGQPVEVDFKRTENILDQKIVQESRSCTRNGYCYSCTAEVWHSPDEPDCAYRWAGDCSGTKHVESRVTTAEWLSVLQLVGKDGTATATWKNREIRREDLRTLSACQ